MMTVCLLLACVDDWEARTKDPYVAQRADVSTYGVQSGAERNETPYHPPRNEIGRGRSTTTYAVLTRLTDADVRRILIQWFDLQPDEVGNIYCEHTFTIIKKG